MSYGIPEISPYFQTEDSHYEILFDEFDVHASITNDVYIQVEGTPNIVQQLNVTGSFEITLQVSPKA